MSQESENRFLVLFLLIKTENNFTVRCGILLSGKEETKVLTGYLRCRGMLENDSEILLTHVCALYYLEDKV